MQNAADSAQAALDSVQTQINSAGKNASDQLFEEQKKLSTRARQQQEIFTDAVKQSAEAQKKESLVAVEVVRYSLLITQ